MEKPEDHPPLTEVLLEPGRPQLWITVNDALTHLVDLTPLLDTERGAILGLPKVRQTATLSPDGTALRWTGLTLPWTELERYSLHQVPKAERYRPLLPYLRAHDPQLYPIPPVTPVRLQQLLHLRPPQIERAGAALSVCAPLAQQRLYDIGIILCEYVGHSAMLSLLRRSWPVAERLRDPLLVSIESCLIHGRPDLVERTMIGLILEGST